MPKTPYYPQKDMRQQNASILLRDLWRHGPLSRATLAHRNDLTKATVSAICNDLATHNLITEAGQDRTGLGRPGNLLELNPTARCAIGVEISTNYLAVVVADLCGQPLWRRSHLIAVGSDQTTVLTEAETLIAEAIEQARARAIPLLGIGVGVPGIVSPDPDNLVTASALGWKEVPLKQIWEHRFSLVVVVDNRARTAAMAELFNGSAQDSDNFVYVSIGTDVRSSVEAAVVTSGLPYRGARGLAVDAGHMILDPEGPLCTCGQRGCWQILTDMDRELPLARARLAAGEPSILQRYAAESDATFDHRVIHQAAVNGDALAIEVTRAVLEIHAIGITNLVRLFDPDRVVIGFASAALPPPYQTRMQIMQGMREFDVTGMVRQLLARRGGTPPGIHYAAHGPDAPMLGAAALLVDEFLRTPPVVGA